MKIDRYNCGAASVMEEHPEGEYVDALEYDTVLDALRGLRDLCEKAGFPCDQANALLGDKEFNVTMHDTSEPPVWP